MEVGAVKHQLNNEIIQLKKKLNQAKVQLIHKLTRKANTLKSQNTTENRKPKLQRKAESAIAEVLILKNVRPKELIRFAVTHNGKLEDFINRPTVDNERVYAKILLHKAINEKYKDLRKLFLNMPIDELLMTRKERLKLKKVKKETAEKIKKDRITKNAKAVEEDNDESVNIDSNQNDQIYNSDNDALTNHINDSKFDNELDYYETENDHKKGNEDETENEDGSVNEETYLKINNKTSKNTRTLETDIILEETLQNSAMKLPVKREAEVTIIESHKTQIEHTLEDKNQTPNSNIVKCKQKKESKSKQKIKKPSKKSRKNNVLLAEQNTPVPAKVVDSFFMTATGDHYLTLAEPRAPDEVKEEHNRGNRKIRRAEKFGKPIKPYMIKNFNSSHNIKHSNHEKSRLSNKHYDSFGDSSSSSALNVQLKNSFDTKKIQNKSFYQDRNSLLVSSAVEKRQPDDKVEKLHPSWEAKKQKSGIVQFEGKKVVFS